MQNGSTVDSINESIGERALDKSHRSGASSAGGERRGLQQPSQNSGSVNTQQKESGNVASVVSIDKTGGSQLNVHSRRDAGYMNDLMRSRAIFKCVPVHYREKPGSVVALASFPGSGNTWLRYLLQLSTGEYVFALL